MALAPELQAEYINNAPTDPTLETVFDALYTAVDSFCRQMQKLHGCLPAAEFMQQEVTLKMSVLFYGREVEQYRGKYFYYADTQLWLIDELDPPAGVLINGWQVPPVYAR